MVSVPGADAVAKLAKAATTSKKLNHPKLQDIYSCEPTRWYGVRPYGFQYTDANNESWNLFLPINPSDLQITTHFATNVVTTLYGVVEEHSEVRYYDIVIQGTTGYAPKRTSIFSGSGKGTVGAAGAAKAEKIFDKGSPILKKENEPYYANTANDYLSGRASFKPGAAISAGGFFQQTMAAVNQVMGSAMDLAKSVAKGGRSTAPAAEFATGVNLAQSGYVAFHNLYRFLLYYKKEMAGGNSINSKRKQHPLRFICYKDGVQYDCVPRTFTLTRNASSPMLYNYTITLRAYNLITIGKKGGYTLGSSKLKDLGLDGVDGSLFARMQKVAGKAKGFVGAALAGIGAGGR